MRSNSKAAGPSKIEDKPEKSKDNKTSEDNGVSGKKEDKEQNKAGIRHYSKTVSKISEKSTSESDEETNLEKSVASGTSDVKNSALVQEHVCGDLVWAQISGHPFWPAIITIDPALGVFEKTKKGRGDSVLREYHVQFFGDKGSHCWVSASRILTYSGEISLRSFIATKKKNKKFSSAFPDGKGSSSLKWKCAVTEADDAVSQSRSDRITYFEEYYPLKKSPKQHSLVIKKEKETSSTSIPAEKHKEEPKAIASTTATTKKRGRSELRKTGQDTADSEANSKKEKKQKTIEGSDVTRTRSRRGRKETAETGADNDKEQKGKESNESNSEEDFLGQERKKKKKKLPVKPQQRKKYRKKDSGNFEKFFEKSAPHCYELNSRFADDEDALLRYLTKMWETMNDEEKSKYGEYPGICS